MDAKSAKYYWKKHSDLDSSSEIQFSRFRIQKDVDRQLPTAVMNIFDIVWERFTKFSSDWQFQGESNISDVHYLYRKVMMMNDR